MELIGRRLQVQKHATVGIDAPGVGVCSTLALSLYLVFWLSGFCVSAESILHGLPE